MSALLVQLLLILGLVATLVVLYRTTATARRRQAETRCLCKDQLAELDRLPEFDLSPADWPLRESPPRQLERQR